MPADDLYSVTLDCTINEQNIKNIYRYQQLTGADNADNLWDLFEADVLPSIRDMCSTSLVFNTATVVNEEDATDFWVANIGLNGTQSGENMPTHDAWSFEWITRRTDAKSGGKRLAGVIESTLNNGVPVLSFLVRIGAFMIDCEKDLTSANGTWRPCVKGKRHGSLGMYANFISGIRLVGCTTQNTRKFYTN